MKRVKAKQTNKVLVVFVSGAGIEYASGASGASHGGRGGRGGHPSHLTPAENLPYGSIFEVGSWGSGGGTGSGLGGRGGGLIVVNVTESFVMDGRIDLNADNAKVSFSNKEMMNSLYDQYTVQGPGVDFTTS